MVATNEFGFFSISVDTNKIKTLKVKFLGYYDKTVTINNYKQTLNIQLQSNTNIGTVYVYANSRNLNYYTFSTDEIKKLPSLTGEKDVVKSLQLMPGVQFGNEGTSDLYVRGGTPDQNLILLDDMPMHFVSHLGSFVSIFDVNAINSIKLIKNGFPAKYEISISAFYKTMNNLIDYKRYFYVTDTVTNPTWEQQIVTNGSGKIYGLEFLAEKKSGKFTGWISYTYMKNYRQFEDLNDGEPFPFNYDRRHNLKIVAQFSFNKNLSLNAIFMFGSGYPISLPIIKQNLVEVIEGEDASIADWRVIVPENTYYYSQLNFDEVTYVFNKINSYRMPAYHRLDISLNWSKEKKRGTRTWTFGIYNVYNHQNAYFLFLAYDTPEYPDLNKKYPVALYKFTLFPIIPSISYSFKFK